MNNPDEEPFEELADDQPTTSLTVEADVATAPNFEDHEILITGNWQTLPSLPIIDLE